MPQATIEDVWIYIHEQGEVRTRDLEREFVKTKKISRGTLYNYKRTLESEGKIEVKTVQAKPPHNIYFVPEKFRGLLTALIQFDASTSKTQYINANDIAWEPTLPGYWFTPIDRKILWQDEETGAQLVLHRARPQGFSEPVHYHPHANKWLYGLYGEFEMQDGTRQSVEGLVVYVPKGEIHGSPKITKETMSLSFFDGPRTKIPITIEDPEQHVAKDYESAFQNKSSD